jgi:protein SCO1
MKRSQKILVTTVWALAVMVMLGIVGMGLWGHRTEASPALFSAPAFSLTDQNGRTMTDATLRGNVWIAMVFFTECPGVCPMMSARMAQLQKTVVRPDVKIISLSLDPEHDTPEVLKGYADRFGADSARWHMLTGPKQTMYDLARAFKLAAEPAHDGQPIVHTQKVLLIDRGNCVRGVYDTSDDTSMKKLAEDAEDLAAEETGSGS